MSLEVKPTDPEVLRILAADTYLAKHLEELSDALGVCRVYSKQLISKYKDGPFYPLYIDLVGDWYSRHYKMDASIQNFIGILENIQAKNCAELLREIAGLPTHACASVALLQKNGCQPRNLEKSVVTSLVNQPTINQGGIEQLAVKDTSTDDTPQTDNPTNEIIGCQSNVTDALLNKKKEPTAHNPGNTTGNFHPDDANIKSSCREYCICVVLLSVFLSVLTVFLYFQNSSSIDSQDFTDQQPQNYPHSSTNTNDNDTDAVTPLNRAIILEDAEQITQLSNITYCHPSSNFKTSNKQPFNTTNSRSISIMPLKWSNGTLDLCHRSKIILFVSEMPLKDNETGQFNLPRIECPENVTALVVYVPLPEVHLQFLLRSFCRLANITFEDLRNCNTNLEWRATLPKFVHSSVLFIRWIGIRYCSNFYKKIHDMFSFPNLSEMDLHCVDNADVDMLSSSVEGIANESKSFQIMRCTNDNLELCYKLNASFSNKFISSRLQTCSDSNVQ